MNIIVITTATRTDLLTQTLESAANNAEHWEQHHLTLVIDGHDHWLKGKPVSRELPGHVLINTAESVGASRARNIGAGSIPRYRRQEHVLFLDDDVYMVPNWDKRLSDLARWTGNRILSGYSHPFNQCEHKTATVSTSRRVEHPTGIVESTEQINYDEPLVISSVSMMMPWDIFDAVGPWDEPGGPGGSEDYALCMRAKDRRHGFAVTDPHCVLHTGLMSSSGSAIVGYKELCEQNDKLLDFYNIRGQVIFS